VRSPILKTVLLVEDTEDELFLFKKACERARVTFSLQVARDGEQAIAYLSGQGDYSDREKYPMPTLVILDINMPSVSGFEVLRWIRANPNAKQLIVVMFTTSSAESDVSHAYALLANSYLVKPVNVSTLVDTVSTLEKYWLNMNLAPVRPVVSI